MPKDNKVTIVQNPARSETPRTLEGIGAERTVTASPTNNEQTKIDDFMVNGESVTVRDVLTHHLRHLRRSLRCNEFPIHSTTPNSISKARAGIGKSQSNNFQI